jgi:hypothetical protein
MRLDSDLEELYTPEEVAEYLRTNVDTVDLLMQLGTLGYVEIYDDQVVVPKSYLLNFIRR